MQTPKKKPKKIRSMVEAVCRRKLWPGGWWGAKQKKEEEEGKTKKVC